MKSDIRHINSGQAQAQFEPKAPSGIVIVNWNGWADSLECLEAVFKMESFIGPIVVCDNGSSDRSIELIRLWAEGRLSIIPESSDSRIISLVHPPIQKPVSFLIIKESEIDHLTVAMQEVRLIIIEIKENVGFAAGNNIGIKFLKKFFDPNWYWLLNSDAVPQKLAFSALNTFMSISGKPKIVGSVLLEYYEPDKIQAWGGRYRYFSGATSHFLEGVKLDEVKKHPERVDYPVGASMAVNSLFIEDTGLLCEDYFLYYEEIDWVLRRHSKALIISESLVFHKGGRATQAGRYPKFRGLNADYYGLRSRILLAKKQTAISMLSIVLLAALAVLRRFARPVPRGGVNAVHAFADGVKGVTGIRKR